MDATKLEQKAKELALKHGVDMIVLFGSRADGTATKHSDVDIAYMKSEQLPFEDELSIGGELAALYGTEAVDVVYLNRTSPAFMFEIMKKAKLLYAKDEIIFPQMFSYAVKRLHENMFLYDLKYERLCAEYGV